MNKLIGVALLSGAAAMGAAARAEGSEKSNYSVEQKLQKLTEELNLNSDQQAHLRTVLEEQKAKKDSLTSKSRMAREAHKVETRKRVRELLTEEQKALYDEINNKNWDRNGDPQGREEQGAMPAGRMQSGAPAGGS